MKFGFRIPSLKKILSARGTGNFEKNIKKETFPLYEKTSIDWVKNSKELTYSKVSHKRMTGLLVPSIIFITISIFAFGHSGRTDSSGGHRDNQNKSGLGYYHYHHGYSAHLHHNGICPYETPVQNQPKKEMSKKEVLEKLDKLGYNGKNAITEFQLDYDLVPDGIAGKKTIEIIKDLLDE